MGNERTPRGTGWRGDDYRRSDYGSDRGGNYSSARDYQASGGYDRDDDRGGHGGSGGYGSQNSGSRSFGGGYDRDQNDQRYGNDDRSQARYARGDEYHGSYASDGRRFEDVGDRRGWDDDNRDRNRGYGQQRYGQSSYDQDRNNHSNRDRQQNRSYGAQPQGYDYQDRGFFNRAGDEVRSWFGDEDAERRREMDSRHDERQSRQRGDDERDSHYHNWRAGQMAALDRDYHEYRNENRTKFENEFTSWRSNRQTQRDSLNQVKEHAEVVGSDGSHVGTVDKVRGDRILLTKNDADAGGQHHSIPSSWISKVDDKKVTLSKTADEAKKHWRDEESNQAMFRYGDNDRGEQQNKDQGGKTDLNRSFSGTYRGAE